VDDVNSWIEEAYKHFGRLDGAANVAGVAGGDGTTTVASIVCRFPCLPSEDWDSQRFKGRQGLESHVEHQPQRSHVLHEGATPHHH
jgi:hypothetical protein